ncbi:bifunctional phosphoribosylaminoimidazolecarboxamide formyltransferase/IMP cyclohydrolase [Microbacterium sp. Bi128]|uniref:bifunctional phosphoribosylaminoimidazolecarboxamide formyltransferase/IMP cyclohydrolase n=1 Tax=Microbacterium sp. Bi128 TaxID=2821115 RepID=UPI001D4DB21E|nr:bifunctional phosphoribosylaminoimidazolecarboxamide formyltransferase/IMP cyclohydrolase [Microbacterium sp. Bi128]CAH0302932.1 Bifunctional purine biosynthesis protein PurH [Microbacterium sp. Bi128]
MSFTQLDRVSIDRVPIHRALISVYDKTGLEELAQGLHAAGVKIVSTGSTAKKIAAAGIPVQEVEEVTGSPEMLDGRVKTLHPRVHGGILADRRVPAHMQTLADMEIEPFDLVVVNLYPFVETVKSGAAPDDVVEQIDIGGPAMVRSAAKNHAAVAIVVDPASYGAVVEAAASGGFDLKTRRRLAAKAFAHTAAYDTAVATWTASQFRDEDGDGVIDWPAYAGLALERSEVLRYGENPHQQAALYVDKAAPAGIAQADQLHGKAMSYNNFVDADAALRAAFDFAEPAVAIIKHANPCGVAVGSASAADPIADAHAKAHACDPVSAFGGVIAANRTVTAGMARTVAGIFTEVVIAPGFDDEAVEILSKKKNIRLLALPDGYGRYPTEFRQVSGGMLVQATDKVDADGDTPANWTLAAGAAADAATLADLAFAWTACRAAKSNAILLADNGTVIDLRDHQADIVGQVEVGFVYVDGSSVGEVTEADLKDRQTLGDEGFISIITVIHRATGKVVSGPEIHARGVAEDDSVFDEIIPKINEALEEAVLNRTDHTTHQLQQVVRRVVGTWVNRKLRRKPMIIPVVLEA